MMVLVLLLLVLSLWVLHPLCTLLQWCMLLELVILHRVEGAPHACCYGDTRDGEFKLWPCGLGRFFSMGGFLSEERGGGGAGFVIVASIKDCGDVRVYERPYYYTV